MSNISFFGKEEIVYAIDSVNVDGKLFINIKGCKLDNTLANITYLSFESELPSDLTDLKVLNDNIFCLIGGNIYIFSSIKDSVYNIDINSQYSRFEVLNDSLLLLYSIYNYHPLDGFSGLEFQTINYLNGERIMRVQNRFSGIFLSHLSVDWLKYCNGYIYVAEPFSGMIKVYDLDLKLVDSLTSEKIFKPAIKSIYFQKEIDSLISFERKRMLSVYNSDSTNVPNSFIYNKSFIKRISDTVRKTYSYVEKLINVDDSLLALIIYRPGYNFNYRDFVIFSPKTGFVIRKFIKWQSTSLNYINNIEDIVTVDLSYSRGEVPVFKYGKIYVPMVFPLSKFRKGNLEDLQEIKLNYNINYGEPWQIGVFTY